MRQNWTQGHGVTPAPRTLEAGWPPAGGLHLGRRAGVLIGAARSTAIDVAERGAQIAILLAASITVLAIMGALDAATGSLPAFDLDREINLHKGLSGMNYPALFSGALLFVAAAFALEVSTLSERLPWVPLGLFLAFMASDELMAIHETLERSVGVNWQILYLPIVAILGPFWLVALVKMRGLESERFLWLGGAAAWIAAQSLEFVFWNIGALSAFHGGMTFMEEILEMSGSAMFLVALYLTSRRLVNGEAALGRHHARA